MSNRTAWYATLVLLVATVLLFIAAVDKGQRDGVIQREKLQQSIRQETDKRIKQETLLVHRRLGNLEKEIDRLNLDNIGEDSSIWDLEQDVNNIKQSLLDLKKSKPVIEVEKEVTLPDRVEQVAPSVVHIMNETQGWQGSGVAITKDIILTARHVVEGGVDFTITLSDECELKATRAISSKKYDLGFIKIDNLMCTEELSVLVQDVDRLKELKPAKLGNIKDCRLGQQVFTIGSPYGKLNFNSITLGIISGLDRDFDEWATDYGYEEFGWAVTFTTDAAGHPGNSGCAVFTMDGRVRGILVGGFSPVLIYCVPVDLVAKDLVLIDIMFALDNYRLEVRAYIWDGYNQETK